mmetsp:Transcript_4260/g.9976  ORF Transcript_4260/g.9976 Transcript_4260/m.9976 type:complete len:174 (-) Transcript_4260:288-809(-)
MSIVRALRKTATRRFTGRFVSSSASQDGKLPWHLWIPMPQISPSMGKAKILKWNVKEGDKVMMTELLAHLEVDRLLSDAKLDKPLSKEMLFEAHEEGYLARIFVSEGGSAPPGRPIALLCESEEDIEKFSDLEPVEDASDSMFVWQAYVADARSVQEHCRVPEHNQTGTKRGC